MFEISFGKRRVFISDHKGKEWIMSRRTFNRARRRAQRGRSIRNPVSVVISDSQYVFTRNEWEKAREEAKRHLDDTHSLMRQEILEKIKMSKRLQPRRAVRLCLEANRAARQPGE